MFVYLSFAYFDIKDLTLMINFLSRLRKQLCILQKLSQLIDGATLPFID